MDVKKIFNGDYLDMVFWNKNKKYGGYELRKNYKKRLVAGSLLAFLLLGGAFATPIVMKYLMPPEEIPEEVVMIPEAIELKEFEEPPEINETKPPPPKPAAVPPPPKPQFKMTPPVITKNEKVKKEDQVVDQNKVEKDLLPGKITLTDPSKTSKTGADPGLITSDKGSGNSDLVVVNDDADKNKIHRQVDVQAEPPYSFTGFLDDNVQYPEVARAEQISGTVRVQFVVNADGTLSNFTVVGKSPHPLLSQEALRVMKKMPKWKPASINGKPVRQYITKPVTFRLK